MKKRKRKDQLMILDDGRLIIFRHRMSPSVYHFFPMLSAVCGCLLLIFAALSLLSPPITGGDRHLVLNTAAAEYGSVVMKLRIWEHQSGCYYGCSNASDYFIPAEKNTQPNRFLLVRTSGGLNQQRTGITDAVVAAYILGATLVVPKLDQESFWKDASNFSEIFDMDWFISYLSKDVRIVKYLPDEAGRVVTTHVPRKCDPKCYRTHILPIFDRKHVQAVELKKFDYRLSNQLDVDLQKLRCRVNYHALRFTDPILKMGQKLVEKMRMKSKHFLALHLRYEPDMLAFSGCYYGGGAKEIKELGEMRKRWRTLHTKDPERERRNGKCPLSPVEVGLMLRALGFGNEVHVYVASGEIYGGEEVMAPLKALFPNFHTKETIASKEELAEFSAHSSRMAALDFIVSDESDVFVTNNNGNMARILAGRRKYFGHKPTIRPNAKKLYQLFLKRGNMTWEEFASHVQAFQIGFMGEPKVKVHPAGRAAQFHENPLACLCKNPQSDSTFASSNLENHVQVGSRGRQKSQILVRG